MLRAEFQAEHGQYIPEDFCLYVENPPNRWTIKTWNNEPLETLPVIENDLLEEVGPVYTCSLHFADECHPRSGEAAEGWIRDKPEFIVCGVTM